MAAYYDYIDTLQTLPKDLAQIIERCRVAETELRLDLARRGVDISDYVPTKQARYAPAADEPMVEDEQKPIEQETVVDGPQVTRSWVEGTGRDLLAQLRWEHFDGIYVTVPAMLAAIFHVRKNARRYAKGTLPHEAVRLAASYARGKAKIVKHGQPSYRPEYHRTRHINHVTH